MVTHDGNSANGWKVIKIMEVMKKDQRSNMTKIMNNDSCQEPQMLYFVGSGSSLVRAPNTVICSICSLANVEMCSIRNCSS